MGLLGQRNYGNAIKIGNSPLTLYESGCAASCVAMINNRFGANCTPVDVVQHTEFFTKAGLILWNQLNDSPHPLKNAKFDWREYGVDMPKIQQYLADFENKAVMLQLKIYHSDGPPSYHWVLAEKLAQGFNGVFEDADPWLCNYGLSNIYGPVVGAAFFSKRNPPLP